jgi:predicted metal-dependent HD superfamily phosphohydrolase
VKKLSIIDLAAETASNLLSENLREDYTYHSLAHTNEVATVVEEIGINMGLSSDQLEIVIIAAWFHDTGYTEGAENHEEISVSNVRSFCHGQRYDAAKTQMIVECIMATKMPQSPNSLMEETICDADLHHLGTKEYFSKASLLLEELQCSKLKGLTEGDWLKMNKEFMESHDYFTEYARIVYGPKKEENLRMIIGKLNENKNG